MILFGENINLVKINTTEALSGAGMVVRARGNKHILVSYHQNIGLNHNKKVTNKSLKCEGVYIYGCNYNKLNQIYILYLRVNSL
jgi:hypothetical protein